MSQNRVSSGKEQEEGNDGEEMLVDMAGLTEQRQHVTESLDDEDEGDEMIATSGNGLNVTGLDPHRPILEQERFLPIANVARIMKRMTPESGKIAKEAKECVQECVSEFISFVTSEASDKCLQEKRKTINGDDLLNAMQTLGFDNFIEPLKLYITRYREAMKADRASTSTTAGADPGADQQEGAREENSEESAAHTLHLPSSLTASNKPLIYYDPTTGQSYQLLPVQIASSITNSRDELIPQIVQIQPHDQSTSNGSNQDNS